MVHLHRRGSTLAGTNKTNKQFQLEDEDDDDLGELQVLNGPILRLMEVIYLVSQVFDS